MEQSTLIPKAINQHVSRSNATTQTNYSINFRKSVEAPNFTIELTSFYYNPSNYKTSSFGIQL